MTLTIKPIVGIFAVAGLSIIVTGCDDWDDFGRIVEGKPTKAQVAHEQASVSYYVSPTPSVERVEVALETEIVPAECIVPPLRFRELWCNPDTGILETIR
jgi:hypothetical protein